MALISCPECGREKVSNTTTSCPSCGYNIAEHFKRLQEEEQLLKKEQEEKVQKQKEIEKLIREGVLGEETIKGIRRGWDMDEEIERDKMISRMSVPKDPAETNSGCFGYGCATFFIGVPLLGLMFLILSGIRIDISAKDTIWMILSIGAGICAFFYTRRERAKEKAEYERYKEMGDYAYKEERFNATDGLYGYTSYTRSSIVCPMCHMPAGERISTLDRSISVASQGLASPLIGKQYRCTHCFHKW